MFIDFRRFSSIFVDFRRFSGDIGVILGSLWVTLGSLWGHPGGTLEPHLRQFDVEKHEMASVMSICAGLVGPKSENVKKVLVFKAFLKGSRGARLSQENEQRSERDRWEGVGGG